MLLEKSGITRLTLNQEEGAENRIQEKEPLHPGASLSHSSASPGLQGNLRAGQDMGKVWGDYKDGCAMSGANGTHLSLRSLCAPLKPLQHEAHLWSMSCVTSYVTADLLEFK